MSTTTRTATKTPDALRTAPTQPVAPTTPARVPDPRPSNIEFKSAFVTGAGATQRVPTSEEIRARAYEIYRARVTAGTFGSAESDWTQAERELRTRA